MRLPFVDVVIPHLDDHDRLAVCLDLLHRQSYPADSYRILVVDNGSAAPVDAVTARFPLASAAFEAERGCVSARNRGARLTAGDILAFTDSDCRPDPDWLLNAVRRLVGGESDIVAGDIRVFCADPDHPTDAELYETVFGFEQRRYVERKHFAAGANIVVPRPVFETVGPFRDGTQPEDFEWGRRAHALGLRLGFAPDVVIGHPARRSWGDLKDKAARTTWHFRNYMGERRSFRLRWLLYTCGMALPPLWKCGQLLASGQLRSPGQRWRAIRMLFRVRYYRLGVMARYLVAGKAVG